MRMIPLTIALALIASSATAHEPRKGPNGGPLVDAGAYHVEVVAAGTRVDVFVTSGKDAPEQSSGFKALAILVIDGKTQRIVLEPSADGKVLTGTAPSAVTTIKGAVQLTDKDGKTGTGRIN